LKNISDKKRASSFHLALVLGEGRAQCRGQWAAPAITYVTTLPEDGEITRSRILQMVCFGSRTCCCKLVACRRWQKSYASLFLAVPLCILNSPRMI